MEKEALPAVKRLFWGHGYLFALFGFDSIERNSIEFQCRKCVLLFSVASAARVAPFRCPTALAAATAAMSRASVPFHSYPREHKYLQRNNRAHLLDLADAVNNVVNSGTQESVRPSVRRSVADERGALDMEYRGNNSATDSAFERSLEIPRLM